MSSTPRRSELKRLPKKDRKAVARELARIEREREVARRRRHRRLGWTGAGLTVVAVGVVAVLVAQSAARAARIGPLNMLSDGIVLTGDGSAVTATRTAALAADATPTATVADRSAGVVDFVLYLDYRSPEAATFWSTAGADLASWVTAGYATLEIHPLALLDGTTVAAPSASPTPTDPTATDPAATQDPATGLETTGDYSLRAANALACVAQSVPDNALSVHEALIAAQPGLDAAGLTDDELTTLVQGTGITDPAVTDCLTGHEFTDWAQAATDRAAAGTGAPAGPVTTSPVLLVAGQEYTGALDDADALVAFLTQVSEQLAAEAATTDGATDDGTDPAADASAG